MSGRTGLSRGFRRAVAALLLLVVSFGQSPVRAAVPTLPVGAVVSPLPSSMTRAFLTVTVNGVSKGELLVQLTATDVLVRLADSKALGLTGLTPQVVTVSGAPFFSLQSLAPVLVYTLDQASLTLNLQVQPAYLTPTVVDFQLPQVPQAELVYVEDTSAFVNYAVGWDQGLTAATEVGFNFGTHSLNSNLNFQGGRLTRGLTSLTLNNPFSVSRWRLGDAYADSGTLGGTTFLGGVTYERQFSLNPFASYQPSFGLQGVTATPSTLDVFVNGRLVRSQSLNPGPFQLQNLPVNTGRGAVQAVVRDAFGRQQDLAANIYKPVLGLRRGAEDFSYSVGFLRPRLSDSLLGQYGELALSARHAVGLSDSLTLGVRLEATPQLLSGGANLLWLLPGQWGQLDLTGALSQNMGQSGTALSLGYSFTSPSVSLNLQAQWLSDHYANLSLFSRDNRSTLALNASAVLPLTPRLQLRPGYTRTTFRDGGTVQALSLGLNASLGRSALFLTVSHNQESGAPADNRLALNVLVPLGQDDTALLQVNQAREGLGGSVSFNHALPPQTQGFDLGYRLEQGFGAHQLTRFQGQYQTPLGVATADLTRLGATARATVSFAGGLALVGGKVVPTRPLYGAFALAQVPQLANVRVLLNNRVVGRTGVDGTLFVPNLVSSATNRLSIEPKDIPLRYKIEAIQVNVVPSPRAGGKVVFAVQATQAVVGKVRLHSDRERAPPVAAVASLTPALTAMAPARLAVPPNDVPAYGQLTLVPTKPLAAASSGSSTPLTSPLGSDGEFYLENVPAGAYTVQVSFDGKTYQSQLTVRSTTQAQVDLGFLVVSAVASDVKPGPTDSPAL